MTTAAEEGIEEGTEVGRVLEKTRVFVFALKAGGTAKTSSATSLAVVLGQRGYRVLVVDLDPQCNCSAVLGWARFEEGQPGITDVMKEEAQLADVVVQARFQIGEIIEDASAVEGDGSDDGKVPADPYEVIENVYLVPGNVEDPDIDESERLLNDPKFADSYWLRDGLAEMDGQWDVVIFDCPATYGRATVTAFITLDDTVDGEVIPPVLCTFKEAGALVRLEKKLQEIRDTRKYAKKGIRPEMRRILLTSVPTSRFGTDEHRRTLLEIQEEYGQMLLPLIHWSGEVPKIYRFECAVPVLAPNSRPSQEYKKVATALGLPELQ